MDKYVKANKPLPLEDDEVRIATSSWIKDSIKDAKKKLDASNEAHVRIRGTGRAIPNVIRTVEALRNLVVGLHQLAIPSLSVVKDEWHPLEEGLEVVVNVKKIPCLEIILSKDGNYIDHKAPGYTMPLLESDMDPSIYNSLIKSETEFRKKPYTPKQYGNMTYRKPIGNRGEDREIPNRGGKRKVPSRNLENFKREMN